jgi:FKBP-type peptidyl-prolyl cis-trans isomerase SlpA
MKQPNVVRPGSRVELHLQILLADGTEVLSSFGADAMELALGDGTLVPGLENLLIGLRVGADERFLADGEVLYGPRDESKIHWLGRSDFPPELDLVRGQIIAFDAPGGQEISGLLLKTQGDRVQVDFNHPLSGRSLQIRARIISVTEPGSATTTLADD